MSFTGDRDRWANPTSPSHVGFPHPGDLSLRELAGKFLIQDFPHRQRHNHLAALAEEGVDFAQGVVGAVQIAEAHSLPLGL